MVALAGCRPADRVANLMCGSGTLLVERLLAGPAATAVGVDLSEHALDAARTNLAAAGVEAELVLGDATDQRTLGARTFDLLLADPPWGDLHGSGAEAGRVHAGLLEAAFALAAPRARLVVVTGQVAVMNRVVRSAGDRWDAEEPRRVFAKGHHPRLYLLRRR
jgi:23S rRNA G2445 N2-methylase RlmL